MPRTAAVLISVPQESSRTLAEVLKETRFLEQELLKTSFPRFRKAQNGGALIEISGAEDPLLTDLQRSFCGLLVRSGGTGQSSPEVCRVATLGDRRLDYG